MNQENNIFSSNGQTNNFNQLPLNNKSPRKINIGLIFCLFLIGIIIIGIIIFISESGKTDLDNDNQNNKTNNNIVESDKPLYEGDNLTVINNDYFEGEVQGKIIDIGNNGLITYAITSDKKIYYHTVYKYNYLTNLNSNFKNIEAELICGDQLIVRNNDNTYTIYSDLVGNRIYNFKADNLVCARVAGSYFYAYTLDNGKLNVTNYEIVNNEIKEISKQHLIVDESNAKLTSGEDNYYGKYNKIYAGNIVLTAIREDGLSYGIMLNFESIDKSNTNGNLGIIENVNAIHSVRKSIVSIYSKNNDNSIYLRKGIKDFKLPLPDNYLINDVKNIYTTQSSEVLLVMNDGNVYYIYDASSSSNWSKLEDISNLIKNNKIVKIDETTTSIIVLCNDGYIYNID